MLAPSVFLYFFPAHTNFRNAATILRQVSFEFLVKDFILLFILLLFYSASLRYGSFAVSSCLSSRVGHLGKYVSVRFHKFQSHIRNGWTFTISERRTRGENISTYWLQNVYGRRSLGGKEPPTFILPLDHTRFQLRFCATTAVRLSYRLLPVVKLYRSKWSGALQSTKDNL